eukprot:2400994-Prymnesium_polylepis.2
MRCGDDSCSERPGQHLAESLRVECKSGVIRSRKQRAVACTGSSAGQKPRPARRHHSGEGRCLLSPAKATCDQLEKELLRRRRGRMQLQQYAPRSDQARCLGGGRSMQSQHHRRATPTPHRGRSPAPRPLEK